MAQAQFSLENALRFLKDEVSNDTSHSSLFKADAERSQWSMTDGNDCTIRVVKIGYTGPGTPGQPNRLPNIAYSITFPGSSNTKLYSYVSFPSSDPVTNQATFVLCVDYFLENPNTFTCTRKAT